jgi:putative methyltransferase (TIGR04325 family)
MVKYTVNLFNKILHKIILSRYNKKFEDFESARAFCEKHTKNSYDNEELNKYRLRKFKDNVELLPYVFNNSRFSLLESVSLYFHNHNKFPKILDFGGLFAEDKLYLEKLYNVEFVYDIVEIKIICELAKELKHSNFYSDIKEPFLNSKNHYDMIFTSGAIQCFENPYEIISEIFSKKVEYVVFTRTNLSDDEGNYSTASFLSGHGPCEGHVKYGTPDLKKLIVMASKQTKEEKLLDIAKKYNYKTLRTFGGLTGAYGENSYTKDFIFKLQ